MSQIKADGEIVAFVLVVYRIILLLLYQERLRTLTPRRNYSDTLLSNNMYMVPGICVQPVWRYRVHVVRTAVACQHCTRFVACNMPLFLFLFFGSWESIGYLPGTRYICHPGLAMAATPL